MLKMTSNAIDASQQRAAKVAGSAYLVALVLSIFAEFHVRGNLVTADVTQSAINIAGHDRLFRLGIASNLAAFAVDVALIIALYVILKPINSTVALLAAGWGLIETSILAVAVLYDLDALRILGGSDYLHSFEASQLQAMARLQVSAHSAAYNVGLIFAGLRSTAFCYLWFRSRFIPPVLAVWGILASTLMGTCSFVFIIFPGLAKAIPVMIYGGPIFLFELAMGFWLLFRRLQFPEVIKQDTI